MVGLQQVDLNIFGIAEAGSDWPVGCESKFITRKPSFHIRRLDFSLAVCTPREISEQTLDDMLFAGDRGSGLVLRRRKVFSRKARAG